MTEVFKQKSCLALLGKNDKTHGYVRFEVEFYGQPDLEARIIELENQLTYVTSFCKHVMELKPAVSAERVAWQLLDTLKGL